MHPLPESLVDYVFDFGALHPDTEKLYIRAMLKSCLAAVPAAAAAGAAGAAAGLLILHQSRVTKLSRPFPPLYGSSIRRCFDDISEFMACRNVFPLYF